MPEEFNIEDLMLASQVGKIKMVPIYSAFALLWLMVVEKRGQGYSDMSAQSIVGMSVE